jgi:Cytochrome P460
MWSGNVVWNLGRLSLLAGCAFGLSCGTNGPTSATPSDGTGMIRSDTALFTLITQTEPFGSYELFPNLPGNSTGSTVSGSSAHQPRIRVSMNAKAFRALQNGRLPLGTTFPDGSTIFKEVVGSNGATTLYTVMYRERGNSRAGNGWLWAEYSPEGGTRYSLANQGRACTGCHSLDQGPRNDFVRSFERQQ